MNQKTISMYRNIKILALALSLIVCFGCNSDFQYGSKPKVSIIVNSGMNKVFFDKEQELFIPFELKNSSVYYLIDCLDSNYFNITRIDSFYVQSMFIKNDESFYDGVLSFFSSNATKHPDVRKEYIVETLKNAALNELLTSDLDICDSLRRIRSYEWILENVGNYTKVFALKSEDNDLFDSLEISSVNTVSTLKDSLVSLLALAKGSINIGILYDIKIPLSDDIGEESKLPIKKPKTPVKKAKPSVKKPKTPIRKPKTPVDKSKTPIKKPKSPIDKPKTPVDKPKTPDETLNSPVKKPKATEEELKNIYRGFFDKDIESFEANYQSIYNHEKCDDLCKNALEKWKSKYDKYKAKNEFDSVIATNLESLLNIIKRKYVN